MRYNHRAIVTTNPNMYLLSNPEITLTPNEHFHC